MDRRFWQLTWLQDGSASIQHDDLHHAAMQPSHSQEQINRGQHVGLGPLPI
jgi:hypothetical protein